MGNEEILYEESCNKLFVKLPDRWEIVWKVTNLVMAVFFFLAAFVNHNDSDWYIWIPVYLLPAILTILIAVDTNITENKYWKNLALVHLLMCCAFSVYQLIILHEVYNDKFSNPLRVEEGREFVGLAIIVFWLSVCRFMSLPSLSGQRTIKVLFLLSVGVSLVPLFSWALCYVGNWHQVLGHCKGMFES
ncbi:transmembrane protein 220 isoform X2 [Octopus bimaculoides]|uniref:Transmembrane protein 220 n=2 Tax=Octopus bimaculoides TaxID=37653 RepID=A0A0L8G6J8_OCTBM|nr:transmembrane protein 220 isoform X2 [Octopus bimaculoides]XP_052824859.1 transmembrane protein 220 isoform X2 [Octopus bimaculoides]|eukprot:XP_014783619.1 PREDICTED: transmembrane protein 220-like isoform X1 [Octopus bimaculoides]